MVVSDVHDYGGGYMLPKFERETDKEAFPSKKASK